VHQFWRKVLLLQMFSGLGSMRVTVAVGIFEAATIPIPVPICPAPTIPICFISVVVVEEVVEESGRWKRDGVVFDVIVRGWRCLALG